MSLTAQEALFFLPAKDFDRSKRFYADLGFVIAWSSGDLARIEAGSAAFLLQRYYASGTDGHLMMALTVEDADAWWQRVVDRNLADRYGVLAEPPADRPWGRRDFPLSDPAGVLWRIGHDLPKR